MTTKYLAKSRIFARALITGAGLIISANGALAAPSAECDEYARDYADRNTSAAGDVLGGAAAGAVGGTILGGIVKGKKGLAPGAGIGAGVGALGGGVRHSQRWRDAYDAAYSDCISSRRARPAHGARQQAYEPWSDEWYDDCAARYRSFDPETGTYVTNSGRKRFCE